MIYVENLTKRFGRRIILNDIGFELARGEHAALLGPNGCGKTTMLRILTGFISATSGTVRIKGWNVMTHSLEARRNIGYLPENVPLYSGFKVDEFLNFRARLKGILRRMVADKVGLVKEQCGLQGVGAVLIGLLSRGMRQRVGLADMLLNEPEILILDEPTLGLDPSESRATCDLLSNLAKRHTLILATHQLAEAERICPRLLLLDRGRLVSHKTHDFLISRQSHAGMLELELRADAADPGALLAQIPGIRKVREIFNDNGRHRLILEHAPDSDIHSAVLRTITEQNWELRTLAGGVSRLEDAYCDWRHGKLQTGDDT